MNILITGCSSGIGYQTALAFASLGTHHVWAISRNVTGLESLKQEFESKESTSTINIIPFDLEKDDMEVLLSKLNLSIENPMDILINNAGYLVSKSFVELSMEDWDKMFRVNLFSSVNLIKSLFPFFNRKAGAHIVNIGSMGGVQGGVKFPGLSAYSASKGAVNILTEALSVEFENEGIRVNAINPGAVQTKMLEEAFPGFQADVSPMQMGTFIAQFAINNKDVMNGRLVQASLKS